MLKIEVLSHHTVLSCFGSPSDLASEMARAVQHVAEKIIASAAPEDRTELAATLAAGWSLAVKNALKEVQSHDER